VQAAERALATAQAGRAMAKSGAGGIDESLLMSNFYMILLS
jgi:hypothetical protein